MALVASLVNRLANHQLFGGRAMWAMAAAAIHLALSQGMRVRLHCLGTCLLVTVEAHFRLRRRCQHRITRIMALMAIGAGDRIFVVTTAMPGKPRIILMTVGAKTILLSNCRHGIGAECENGGALLATSNSC